MYVCMYMYEVKVVFILVFLSIFGYLIRRVALDGWRIRYFQCNRPNANLDEML